MNGDQLKGKWRQFKGELKQQYGKFTDDDLQQIEGNYDKILGLLQERYGGNCAILAQERYGGQKDELIKWAEQWKQKSTPEACGNCPTEWMRFRETSDDTLSHLG